VTIIAVANMAGSAGKTTTAVTLAGMLAEQGRRVRLVDSDGQGNASFHLGQDDPKRTLSDVLTRSATVEEAEVDTCVPGLTLIPASPDLNATAVELTKAIGGDHRLRRALTEAPPVDVTLIDCPGSLTVLTVAALIAADSALTVTQPTLKELAGVPAIEETVDEVSGAYNPALTLSAVVPCVVPSATAGRVYAMALDLLRESYGDLVTPPCGAQPASPRRTPSRHRYTSTPRVSPSQTTTGPSWRTSRPAGCSSPGHDKKPPTPPRQCGRVGGSQLTRSRPSCPDSLTGGDTQAQEIRLRRCKPASRRSRPRSRPGWR
jgi:chromosome partitioning protein